MSELRICPITWQEACEFVALHHRHHKPPQGWKWGIGLARGDQVVGVIMVGRPVARHLDDGATLEVTRCCVMEGVPNGCSKLYAAARQDARAMGYQRLVTYTLASEPGTSLKAAGWKAIRLTSGGSWNTPSRPRVDKGPKDQKTLWEAT